MNNPLSFSSIKLEPFSRDGVALKSSSGFLVEADNQYYLVTNRHVVCDSDLDVAGQQESGNKPHLLKTSLHIYGGEGENSAPLSSGAWKRITIPLYDKDNAPKWIEYRVHQPVADVVVLPIQLDATFMNLLNAGRIAGVTLNREAMRRNRNLKYWNKFSAISISAIDTDVEYGPSDIVHIIGYPHGWAPNGTDKSSTAFWRTSFIASEIYEMGMARRGDTFFVDPCAPEGMTGSPVIGIKNDRLKLLGVYSDHATAEFSANVGYVWSASLVKQLIG